MNPMLTAAAGLILFISAAHSYLGERYILTRLFRRCEMPHLFGGEAFTRNTLRFAWHLTSVAWLGLAAVLLLLSDPATLDRRLLLRSVSACFLITAVVAATASRGRHLSWIVFGAIAALSWLAA